MCGYCKCIGALEFHHTEGKNFDIGSNTKLSYDRLIKEVDKCTLLCSNCHKEIHHDERNILESLLNDTRGVVTILS